MHKKDREFIQVYCLESTTDSSFKSIVFPENEVVLSYLIM